MLLQDDIDRLISWCDNNNMALNVKKCFHLTFTRNINHFITEYKIKNVSLSKVSSTRDLGVIIDSKINFREHISNITFKASKALGFVLRNTKNFKHPKTKIILYNALVRSHLEYCCQVWAPFYDVYKSRIERVQRWFLNSITYNMMKTGQLNSYDKRLKFFELETLYKRRQLSDLMFLYKIVHYKIDCPNLLEYLSISVPTRLPRHGTYKPFSIPLRRTRLGSNSPVARMTQLYNGLSRVTNIDIFGSNICNFKKSIYQHLSQCNN